MNFYEINNLEVLKYKHTTIDMNCMSKIFKDIAKNTSLKTLDDVMNYNIVLLYEGNFTTFNPDVAYMGSIKENNNKVNYCLVGFGKELCIENNDEQYKAKIINGQLLLAPLENFQTIIQKEVNSFKDLTLEEMKVIQWLEVGQTGLSSLTLCASLYPQFESRHYKLENLEINVPHDVADFNRCVKFLQAVPEARAKLDKAKNINKIWDSLIDNWPQLEQKALEKDAKGVQKIIDSCINSKPSIKMAL